MPLIRAPLVITPSVSASPDAGARAVDVVVLTRDGGPPPERVPRAIEAQKSRDLSVRLHVLAGTPRPDDPSRWATIARARNAGKRLGSAPWVMFVDDDVVLAGGCIERLVHGLCCRPGYAALAADYLGESSGSRTTDDIVPT